MDQATALNQRALTLALRALALLAALGVLVSLGALPLAAMMILFNDTGASPDTIAEKVALMATTSFLFGALLASSIMCLDKVTRPRAILLCAVAVAMAGLLLGAPDARLGVQFSLGVAAAIVGGG